jgi:hypothetical protein
MSEAPFLTVQWRHLVMLNSEVESSALTGRVPGGTELDTWRGRTYLSLVGFLFLDTRVLGVPIPFHRDFEEVNLRFYVPRRADDGWVIRRSATAGRASTACSIPPGGWRQRLMPSSTAMSCECTVSPSGRCSEANRPPRFWLTAPR